MLTYLLEGGGGMRRREKNNSGAKLYNKNIK